MGLVGAPARSLNGFLGRRSPRRPRSRRPVWREPEHEGRGHWRDDDAMIRSLFAKPIRRNLSPQDAKGMIAAFEIITGKTLTEERIADIRANYAAFQARKADEREAGRGPRRNATTDLAPPPPSTVLLRSADDVIAACEAMKAPI
jgi:hypothetical protein